MSKLTVSPAESENESPHPSFPPEGFLEAAEPPFAVIGTSKEPFLARVRLDWVGGPSKPLIVTHWVRVGLMRSSK